MINQASSLTRRAAAQAGRWLPSALRDRVALELSVRSLRRSRRRLNNVRELSDLALTWTGYGACSSIRSIQIPDEQSEFFELVAQHRPRYALEIGTCRGGTLFMIASVAAHDACLISVDLPGGIHGGGYTDLQTPFFQRAFPREHQSLHLVRADSAQPETTAEVRRILGTNLLDYLLIDGDHRFEAVRRDFLNYAPLVRRGGLIAFHDVAPYPERDGVDVPRLWSQIRSLAPSVTICSQSNPGHFNGGFGVFTDWNPRALASVA